MRRQLFSPSLRVVSSGQNVLQVYEQPLTHTVQVRRRGEIKLSLPSSSLYRKILSGSVAVCTGLFELPSWEEGLFIQYGSR
jgi:hypothetical protein